MSIDVHLTNTVDACYDPTTGYWTLFDCLGMRSVDRWRTEPEARSAYVAHEVAWEYIIGRSA